MSNVIVSKLMLKNLNVKLCSIEPPKALPKLDFSTAIILAGLPVETPKEIDRLERALSKISSDVKRGTGSIDLSSSPPTDYWLGVIWAIAGLEWDCGKQLARDWSRGCKNRFTADEFETDWSDYDRHHSNPIGIGSVYKLAAQLEPDKEILDVKTTKCSKHDADPISLLYSFSVSGSSQQMRLKMLNDVFVMEGTAILGQWTTIYAAPNTGKTLLTLWLLHEQIEAKVIEGSKVFYVNADDTYRGAVDKTELAERWGMHILLPHNNEFRAGDIVVLMEGLARADQAKGVVLVLDTLKKFTDLMDKRAASIFGITARGFISAGGTLICLAHTNKHKDVDGRGVYSGTSDVVDDSDCVYIVDKINSEGDDLSRVHTVEFVNKKARGDVSSTVAFRYTRSTGESYSNLLDSVQRIGSSDIEHLKRQADISKQLEEDDEIISAIRDCITAGIVTKSEIIKHVVEKTAATHNRVRGVIKHWTGEFYSQGHRWKCNVESHNAYQYSLLKESHPLNNR